MHIAGIDKVETKGLQLSITRVFQLSFVAWSKY